MKKALLILSSLMLFACASQGPIVDRAAGFDSVKYQQDLAECEQVSQQVKAKGVGGAVGGAVVGGLLGAISGDAAEGAGVGAILGGASGLADTKDEKTLVVRNCLKGRGYNVLN
ncbi:glycine zipper domain-containing protein [Pelagibaculum spongiae]|uniref:Glycine zipper family protein n=1 Tax=Pelagibaculum spongiae TaxID=2080658 RepID=A0A2V1H7X5_9GAMM|nr:glycine zipper domain-containing protein [Pelagibaculum spongiae]PVZ72602.1 glycine zipper family protein [Pelagibaculum spongiae]